jgi:hypothetical protein
MNSEYEDNRSFVYGVDAESLYLFYKRKSKIKNILKKINEKRESNKSRG